VIFPKTFIISPISPHAYYTGEVEWVNSTFGVLLVTCPEDIAKAILFLASEDSNFITGQILLVDGGFSLK